jgi:hypothetical protein
MSTTISRIAAGLLVTAGLAVGSAAMAPVAYAESNSSVGADSSTERTTKNKKNKSATTPRRGPVGLNGNRPQTSGKIDQFQHFPKKLDQFKHLPFDPAMPGGD